MDELGCTDSERFLAEMLQRIAGVKPPAEARAWFDGALGRARAARGIENPVGFLQRGIERGTLLVTRSRRALPTEHPHLTLLLALAPANYRAALRKHLTWTEDHRVVACTPELRAIVERLIRENPVPFRLAGDAR